MPFINIGSFPEEEYLSDGITENILTILAKIADLKVISRTSIMQYKKTKKTIKQIGKELKVAYVLEGSVQRSGNMVHITAQFINVKDNYHLWADNYDEEFREVLAIQSKVSQKIASALQARLSKDEKKRIALHFAQMCQDQVLILTIKNQIPDLKKLINNKTMKKHASAEEIAQYYTMAGEKDSAFAWLKRSVQNKEYGGLKYLAVSPYWDSLRNDPRFALVLQNSGIR